MRQSPRGAAEVPQRGEHLMLLLLPCCTSAACVQHMALKKVVFTLRSAWSVTVAGLVLAVAYQYAGWARHARDCPSLLP